LIFQRHLARTPAAPVPMPHQIACTQHRQRGLTLIELLVSLALMLLVILAATSIVAFSSSSFNSLDQVSQMRENARFAKEVITRSVLQAGYQDIANSVLSRSDARLTTGEDPEPDIRGFNNSVVQGADIFQSVDNSRTNRCGSNTTTACVNGSDILIVRYQASARPDNTGVADGSMINCMGFADTPVITSSNDRALSGFSVAIDNVTGEPNLRCSYIDQTGIQRTAPLIQGVESLQFLYGVDGVTPNTVTPAATAITNSPTRYLRADQISVVSNDSATRENWRRVRTVKVGMVLRGPVGSAFQASESDRSLSVFGDDYAPSNAADPFAVFTPAEDGRLRMVVNFTVHLRNDQHVR
jgi:type IV pilus assembly protein PilW